VSKSGPLAPERSPIASPALSVVPVCQARGGIHTSAPLTRNPEARGKRLEEVCEILIESNPLLEATRLAVSGRNSATSPVAAPPARHEMKASTSRQMK
jgi:hypothetical protein